MFAIITYQVTVKQYRNCCPRKINTGAFFRNYNN